MTDIHRFRHLAEIPTDSSIQVEKVIRVDIEIKIDGVAFQIHRLGYCTICALDSQNMCKVSDMYVQSMKIKRNLMDLFLHAQRTAEKNYYYVYTNGASIATNHNLYVIHSMQ